MTLRIHRIYGEFREKNIWDKMNSLSFVAFCLLIIDCTISGAGRWLMLGSLSARMVLGLFAAIFAIPGMVAQIKKWIKNPMCVSLFLFIFFLICSAYMGIKHENSRDVLISDIKGFSWLFLVPVALVVVNSRTRLNTLMNCIIAGAAVQAFAILVINMVCAFFSGFSNILLGYLYNLQIGYVDNITAFMFRIFFKSGPYMVVACCCMVYRQLREERFNWWYAAVTGLCLNAVLLSFTRSLYGAALVAAVIITVLYVVIAVDRRKRLLLHLVAAIFAGIILITFQQVISGANYMKFAIARSLTIDVVDNQQNSDDQGQQGQEKADLEQQQKYIERTKDSDQTIRNTILIELNEKIKQNVIFGNGLGSTIEYRTEGFVEYFYHDILNKMGILGLLLYFFPVAYMVYLLIREWRKKDREIVLLRIAWLCALSAFLVATYFNPYMNAALGISCYSIVIAAFLIERY